MEEYSFENDYEKLRDSRDSITANLELDDPTIGEKSGYKESEQGDWKGIHA